MLIQRWSTRAEATVRHRSIVPSTIEIAAFLLDHGAEIDARDIDHESTPAQYMVDDRQDVARYLVSRGCTDRHPDGARPWVTSTWSDAISTPTQPAFACA